MKIFSFFNFYYNVIKGSPKKYDIAMDNQQGFISLFTPVVLFIVSLIAMMFMPTPLIIYMYLWIPIIVLNFAFVSNTSQKGYKIKHEQEMERDRIIYEEEMRQREIERRLRQEAHERWMREQAKRRAEAEEELRRLRQEYFRRHQKEYKSRGHRENIYTSTNVNDVNYQNAMKLLRLTEGFTEADVKSAYKHLAKTHHPDVGGNEKNFIRLKRAYDYLMKRI